MNNERGTTQTQSGFSRKSRAGVEYFHPISTAKRLFGPELMSFRTSDGRLYARTKMGYVVRLADTQQTED